jgi:DNA polymerase (family 10)
MGSQLKLFPEDFVILGELELKAAEEIASQVKLKLDCCCEKLEVAGSIRRKKTQVHDVDFVAVAQDSGWRRISEELKKLKSKNLCTGSAVIKTLIPCGKDYFQVDFYRAQPSTFGIHKLVRTGSAEHNMWMAGYANSKGMRLQYSQGLMKDGKALAGEDEKGVFEAIGLPCPVPEKREIINSEPAWRSSQ